MGRVEKLVVLVVLFAITAILVISMNTRSKVGTPEEASLVGLEERHERWSPTDDPGGESQAVEKEEPVAEAPSTSADAAGSEEAGSAVLLTSETEEPPPAPGPDPASTPLEPAIPADWDLVTLEGLGETQDPATLLYTCRAGETFEALATRFYGDADKAELLQRNNEGTRSLDSGRTIFVPVRDDAPAVRGTDYVVQDGDNLWGIAKKLYGKGSRWEEIYEANGTLLSTPDSLRAGMVLRIP